MTRRQSSYASAIVIAALGAAVLFLMRRPPICTCGAIDWWVHSASSPRTSQMLADWYSPSHVIHGILFYAGLWLVARKLPIERRFAIAVFLETAWEVVENSPWAINRYREATVLSGELPHKDRVPPASERVDLAIHNLGGVGEERIDSHVRNPFNRLPQA